MHNVHRYFRPGNSYFVTCNTLGRLPILIEHIDLFWAVWEDVKAKYGVSLDAWVVMPDHFHAILRPVDGNLSGVMSNFKMTYAARYVRLFKQVKGRVWQNRYWDHVIRDESDLERHLVYIHYNPVRAHLCREMGEYPHSSYLLIADQSNRGGKHVIDSKRMNGSEFGE